MTPAAPSLALSKVIKNNINYSTVPKTVVEAHKSLLAQMTHESPRAVLPLHVR